MRWSNYVRRSELPWLIDHEIKSEILLPGSAYLAMGMETIKQKVSISGRQVQGYTLRDVTFSKALVVPDTSHGVEVSIILEPYRQSSVAASDNWSEFRVISFWTDRKAHEHCRGFISVTHDPSLKFSADDKTTLAMMRHDKAMQLELYKKFLSRAASGGSRLGPSIQLVSNSCLKGGNVFCTLHVPNRLNHESPLTISVPLVDCILQVAVLSLTNTTHSTDGAIIPTSIAELSMSASISQDPSYLLHARRFTTDRST